MSNTVNNYTETDLGNISLNPRGEYDSSVEYEYLDAVSYQGGSYFCLAELETTITGIAPDAGRNSEHWQMIAAPGDMTPEYTAAYNNVINKAVQVEESRAAVELAQQEIEAVQTDVQQLHSDTVQTAQEAENSKNSAADSAQSAEQSRKTASESERNINGQIAGFDSRVSEAVEQSKEEINTTKQQAINTITKQQTTSVNTVKTEGEKIITRVGNDAKTVADDRATVEEATQTVLNNAQEVARNAQIVAGNTENAAASAESAKTSADNAAQSAKGVEDASKQIEQNKKDVDSLKEDLDNVEHCFNVSPNLYDINASGVLNGAYLNLSDGVSVISDASTANWRTSDYIDIDGHSTMYLYRNNSSGKLTALNARVYWYNESKIFINGKNTITSVVAIPEGAKYARISEEISIQYGYKCSLSTIDILKITDYGEIFSLKDEYYERGEGKNYDDIISKITNKMEFYSSPNLYNTEDETWENGYISQSGGSGAGDYKHKFFDVSEGDIFYSYYTDENGKLESDRTSSSSTWGMRWVTAYKSDGAIVADLGSANAIHTYVVPAGITRVCISVRTKYTTCLTKNIDLIGQPYIEQFAPYYRAKKEFIEGVDIDIPKSLNTAVFGDVGIRKTLTSASDTQINLEKNSVKKNKSLSFFSDIMSFDFVTVGHGKAEYGGNYVTVNNTEVIVYKYDYKASVVKTINHGLAILNNIGIIIKVANKGKADIVIVSNGHSIEINDVAWSGTNGQIFADIPSTTVLTNISFSWVCNDYKKNVWIFGDSYISVDNIERWTYYLLNWCGDNALFNAYPGETSAGAYPDLQNALEHGIPKYLVWCIGMNDKDSTTSINSGYKTYIEQIMLICKKYDIELILATIPNTSSIIHTFKNDFIRNSGYRYIDFAKAVGADSYPSTWYDGMMGSDKIHPSEKGAKALAMKAISDFPKFMIN